MIPPQVLIVPVFQQLNLVGLLSTYWAVIFPQVPSVLALFVFKQFFDGLPRDFEEAARIDGAGSSGRSTPESCCPCPGRSSRRWRSSRSWGSGTT